MELFPPISELYPFIVALLIAGTMAGILAGLFGIGGGAILVPVFYQILGVLEVDEAIRMHLSVGTSLAIIVPTSLRSFAGHRAKGVVDMGVLKSFLVVVPAGVVMASIVTAFISGSALRIIFTVFSLAVAMKLLFAKDDWRIGDELPTGLGQVICWLDNRLFLDLHGDWRRRIQQYLHDTLWATHSSSGCDVVRGRSPDLHSRRAWLCLGWLECWWLATVFCRLRQSLDGRDCNPGNAAGCTYRC